MNFITREELKEKLDRGDHFKLIMVLEDWHFRAMHIPGSIHIPARDIARDGLGLDDEIVVYCSHEACPGSMVAYSRLKANGYENVRMNSLDGHSVQRPHRHNSAAMTLPIQCEGIYSVIEGERVDWHPYAIMITPPADLHEHHNEGDEQMRSLVVQDGGLYYHLRTIGFSFG